MLENIQFWHTLPKFSCYEIKLSFGRRKHNHSKRFTAIVRRHFKGRSWTDHVYRVDDNEFNQLGSTYINIFWVSLKKIWDKKIKKWKKRKVGRTIGRIYYAHPTSGEIYYLIILLIIIHGPRSYEEIKTVGGVTYQTFKETCNDLGLLNDNREWNDALNEGSQWATGTQLRELFVTILLYGEVMNIGKLWETNWKTLSDDIVYKKRIMCQHSRLELNNEQIQSYCLIEIDKILVRAGSYLSDFDGMPLPNSQSFEAIENRLIVKSLVIMLMSWKRNSKDVIHCWTNNKLIYIYTVNVTTRFLLDLFYLFIIYVYTCLCVIICICVYFIRG